MHRYTVGRVTVYLATNVALAVMIWVGFAEGHQGARNLASFMIIASLVLQAFLLNDDVLKATVKAGAPSVPSWVAAPISIFCICVLAYNGNFAFAGLLLLSGLFQARLYDDTVIAKAVETIKNDE